MGERVAGERRFYTRDGRCALDRSSRPRDAETAADIHRVLQAAYRVEAELLGVPAFAPLRRTAEEIAGSSSSFYGAYVDGLLGGVVEVELPAYEVPTIAALVVVPELFRRGLGSGLLRHVIHRYGERGLLVSTGLENHPALRLYTGLAFREHSRWTTRDGIPMVTLLRSPSSG